MSATALATIRNEAVSSASSLNESKQQSSQQSVIMLPSQQSLPVSASNFYGKKSQLQVLNTGPIAKEQNNQSLKSTSDNVTEYKSESIATSSSNKREISDIASRAINGHRNISAIDPKEDYADVKSIESLDIKKYATPFKRARRTDNSDSDEQQLDINEFSEQATPSSLSARSHSHRKRAAPISQLQETRESRTKDRDSHASVGYNSETIGKFIENLDKQINEIQSMDLTSNVDSISNIIVDEIPEINALKHLHGTLRKRKHLSKQKLSLEHQKICRVTKGYREIIWFEFYNRKNNFKMKLIQEVTEMISNIQGRAEQRCVLTSTGNENKFQGSWSGYSSYKQDGPELKSLSPSEVLADIELIKSVPPKNQPSLERTDLDLDIDNARTEQKSLIEERWFRKQMRENECQIYQNKNDGNDGLGVLLSAVNGMDYDTSRNSLNGALKDPNESESNSAILILAELDMQNRSAMKSAGSSEKLEIFKSEQTLKQRRKHTIKSAQSSKDLAKATVDVEPTYSGSILPSSQKVVTEESREKNATSSRSSSSSLSSVVVTKDVFYPSNVKGERVPPSSRNSELIANKTCDTQTGDSKNAVIIGLRVIEQKNRNTEGHQSPEANLSQTDHLSNSERLQQRNQASIGQRTGYSVASLIQSSSLSTSEQVPTSHLDSERNTATLSYSMSTQNLQKPSSKQNSTMSPMYTQSSQSKNYTGYPNGISGNGHPQHVDYQDTSTANLGYNRSLGSHESNQLHSTREGSNYFMQHVITSNGYDSDQYSPHVAAPNSQGSQAFHKHIVKDLNYPHDQDTTSLSSVPSHHINSSGQSLSRPFHHETPVSLHSNHASAVIASAPILYHQQAPPPPFSSASTSPSLHNHFARDSVIGPNDYLPRSGYPVDHRSQDFRDIHHCQNMTASYMQHDQYSGSSSNGGPSEQSDIYATLPYNIGHQGPRPALPQSTMLYTLNNPQAQEHNMYYQHYRYYNASNSEHHYPAHALQHQQRLQYGD
ncbi:hypothetical protein V1511DRAFT_278000 [Dipodascopsis uninucleata]